MSKPGLKRNVTTPHPFLDATALPRVLRKWRQEKQMKIETVAADVGVSPAAWGHWETGTRFPQGGVLLRLSTYTGLPLRELICPSAEPPPLPQVEKL
jgi:transcriptional regulator with XRE-family HTH domain